MAAPLALKSENIAQLVFFIRREKVMLDADLAILYGVRTKALNQARFAGIASDFLLTSPFS